MWPDSHLKAIEAGSLAKNLSSQSERFHDFLDHIKVGRALVSRDRSRVISYTVHPFDKFMKGNSLDDVRLKSLQAEKKAGPLNDLPYLRSQQWDRKNLIRCESHLNKRLYNNGTRLQKCFVIFRMYNVRRH